MLVTWWGRGGGRVRGVQYGCTNAFVTVYSTIKLDEFCFFILKLGSNAGCEYTCRVRVSARAPVRARLFACSLPIYVETGGGGEFNLPCPYNLCRNGWRVAS